MLGKAPKLSKLVPIYCSIRPPDLVMKVRWALIRNTSFLTLGPFVQCGRSMSKCVWLH